MSTEPFSHDQAVKNLLKAYPDEALEFLAEDAVQLHGRPVGWEFLDTAVGKEDVAEPGPGQAMDLAIRYQFQDGTSTILVLVEHWSDAGKLDLLRTARYFLDLLRRFPGETILPIALVDDDRPRQLEGTVEHHALDFSPFRFTTRIVQIPALKMERFRDTANRVALSFSPNMAGDFDPVERVVQIALAFRTLDDMAGFRKFFAFWLVEGRLKAEQRQRLRQRLKETDMPEIIDAWIQDGKAEGLEQGIRASKLEDARKMREHGIEWAIVTDVTGLKPEDLESP